MSGTRIAMVGLPNAGKTTYVAAFWATARATPRPDRHTIVSFPDDPTYLQATADAWFAGRPVDRNRSESIQPIVLSLRRKGRADLKLAIPDLSGESFRDAAADRRILPEVAEVVTECSLVLFFVSAATATTPVSLVDLPPEVEEENEDGDGEDPNGDHQGVGDEEDSDEQHQDDTEHSDQEDDDEQASDQEDHEAADDPAHSSEEFDSKALETDILNAELLQLIAELRDDLDAYPPVLVVVSAWDTVSDLGVTPYEWLRTNQPMFAQVVAEHGRSAAVEVMGISAQGGDYSVDPDITTVRPEERPVVVTKEATHQDIGLPFVWFEDLAGSEPDG